MESYLIYFVEAIFLKTFHVKLTSSVTLGPLAFSFRPRANWPPSSTWLVSCSFASARRRMISSTVWRPTSRKIRTGLRRTIEKELMMVHFSILLLRTFISLTWSARCDGRAQLLGCPPEDWSRCPQKPRCQRRRDSGLGHLQTNSSQIRKTATFITRWAVRLQQSKKHLRDNDNNEVLGGR